MLIILLRRRILLILMLILLGKHFLFRIFAFFVCSHFRNFLLVFYAFSFFSDMIMGKADILGFEINPFVSQEEKDNGLIDEFVAFGRKNVKYYEVRLRVERRNGRNQELILPYGKTLVMGKIGGKSSEYEKVYHCCVWLPDQHYLLGGHQGAIYICKKGSCLKKLSTFHDSWVAAMKVIVINDVQKVRYQILKKSKKNSNRKRSSFGDGVVSDEQIGALFGDLPYLIFSASADGKMYQFVNNGYVYFLHDLFVCLFCVCVFFCVFCMFFFLQKVQN